MQVTTPHVAPRKGCTTPAPTSTPASGFVVYSRTQRCLEARPVSSFTNGRRLEPSDPLEDCSNQCFYDAGLALSYYFAVEDGVCYCCQTWCVKGTVCLTTLCFVSGPYSSSKSIHARAYSHPHY